MREDLRELVDRARAVALERALTDECISGEVGSALRTGDGRVYEGVSIDCGCGIGFCAEHSAVAAMVTSGESHVSAIVAVSADGRILPPCGRCRELLVQVSHDNLAAEVVLAEDDVVLLADLLPHRWQELR